MKKAISKLTILLLIMAMVLSFAACGKNNNDNEIEISMDTVFSMAVDLGYNGTLAELIEAFKGDSAYAIAVSKGYTGSENDWLNSLKGAAGAKGDKGDKGDDGATPQIGTNGNWFIGTTDTGIKAQGPQGNKGDKGEDGQDGDKGDKGDKGDGLSAYEIYIKYYDDYKGTELDWINDLTNGNLARFTVIFNSNGGTSVNSLNVRKGTLINEPVQPYKENYEFGGWYNDSGFTNRWNFNTDTVTANTALYAKWIVPYVGELYFTLFNNNTEYAVTGISETYGVNVIIPSEYNGLPVTLIHPFAFQDCVNLISISIPDSIITIYTDTFFSCTGLTDITVDANNPYYSSQNGILFSKDKTNLICYPAGKPDSSYNIPNGVTDIDYWAFMGSVNLASVAIPDSVTNICDEAFYYCLRLTDITVDANNPCFLSQGGVLFKKDKTTLICYPAGKTDTSYTICEDVGTIGIAAFAYCLGLTSIVIPDNVTNIDPLAFAGCANLASIIIGSNVKVIGTGTFILCSSLTSITIPYSVAFMGSTVFAYCDNLQTIHIKGYAQAPVGWHANWKDGYEKGEDWNCDCVE